MHPLLHLLMTQPGLLGEHAQGYAALLGSEITEIKQVGQRYLLWSAATAVCTAAALVLAGVALMLWAMAPVLPAMPTGATWALCATPCLPLAAACFCLQKMRAPMSADAFAQTREQLKTDMQLLKEISAP
jgi:uncharacterized membrane protein YqjE